MKILYYDCFCGISGDMNLAAMIDLGVPQKHILNELKKLAVGGYCIKITRSIKMGIDGVMVLVHVDNDDKATTFTRSYSDIVKLINKSNLSELVKKKSISIFTLIGNAEAKIHKKKLDNIHFHEIGAIDSIVDIVAASICYEYLKVDNIFCSSVHVGGGFVKCEHGMFPVPSPATAEILLDIPIKTGRVKSETTTPTGAAIVKVFTKKFTDKIDFKIKKIGYGIGHHDFCIPNILRVYIGETKDEIVSNDFKQESSLIIECNIDDMPAERFEYVMEKCFKNGAYDVWLSPITMKKSRLAVTFSVLCAPSLERLITEIILMESTSLGVRISSVKKIMLKRFDDSIKTRWGNITIKSAVYNNKIIRSKPEYDECKEIANNYNIPLADIYAEIEMLIKASND